MKNFIRSFPSKIGCFILCILSLCIAAGCVIGAFALVSFDFYGSSEGYLQENFAYEQIYSDSYDITHKALNLNEYYVKNHDKLYARENTNLRYAIYSASGDVVNCNTSSAIKSENEIWRYTIDFGAEKNGQQDNLFYAGNYSTDDAEHFTFKAYLEEELPVKDKYRFISNIVHIGYSLRYLIYVIGFLCVVLSIVCFSALMCVSARRPYTEELYPGPLNRVPFDILIAGCFCIFIFAAFVIDALTTGNIVDMILWIALIIACVCCLIGLSVSLSARIKQKNLIKGCFIYLVLRITFRILRSIGKGILAFCRLTVKFIRSIPLIWRTLAFICGIGFIDFWVFVALLNYSPFPAVIFTLLKYALLFITAVGAALFMRRLKKGGEALAQGDLSYKIETDKMFWDFKKHGENLNSIAKGMSIAVEERLQSERMKAELITNVSHDIKTPLTSIINYAGLIAEKKCSEPAHKEYSEVLTRKSEHLKRLLDDLVEISKANTGNLEVDLIPCDAGVLLSQVTGEFAERCQSAGLELITTAPEKELRIMADSRRIWRVFENLMSNVCKYSLVGSRVYLSLEERGNEVRFIFRNTSKAALNISPLELMERFVRGDSSRTTEGNGLGLSIAKSLAELQQGKMDISIDGDLFKVILSFPTI